MVVVAWEGLAQEEEQFGWWFSQEDRSFDAHHTTECGLGFQER